MCLLKSRLRRAETEVRFIEKMISGTIKTPNNLKKDPLKLLLDMQENHRIIFLCLIFSFVISFSVRSQTWKPRTWKEVYGCDKETFVGYIQRESICFGQRNSWDTVCHGCSYNDLRVPMPDIIYIEFMVISKSVLYTNYCVTAPGRLKKRKVYSYLCQSNSIYKNFSILSTKQLFHVGGKYSTELFPVFDKDCDRIMSSDGDIVTLVHGPSTYLNFFLQDILLIGVLGNTNYFYTNEAVKPQKINE